MRLELEKSSKKYICPKCGKKSFTYYRISGKIIDESVGRCDKIDKCAYHKKPREWYAEHPTDNKKSKSTYLPPIKRETIKDIPKVTSYIPMNCIYY